MGFNFALCMTQKKFRAAGIFGKNFPFVGDLLAINSVWNLKGTSQKFIYLNLKPKVTEGYFSV